LSDLGEEPSDPLSIGTRDVPPGVEVFEINGPLFFGAAYKFEESLQHLKRPPQVLILRMRYVQALDATGIHVLRTLHQSVGGKGTTLVLSGVHSQPLFALQKAGLLDAIGEQNVFGNIDEALARARSIAGP